MKTKDEELKTQVRCKNCGEVLIALKQDKRTICYSCAIEELDNQVTNSQDEE